MAFEAYLQQDRRPRGGRRIIYTVSVLLHGAALLAAVAYSFWHVEELSPPRVVVTLISAAAAPPPPPPPPPLGGGQPTPRIKHVVRPKIEVTPKVAEIVQPKVEPEKKPPEEAPKEPVKEDVKAANSDAPAGAGTPDGVKGGVAGGVKGGVVGGTLGGKGTGPAPPPVAAKFLPPHMAALQKLSTPDPDFPAHLRIAGANHLVMAKICVGTSGAVESVTLQKRAHPTLDENVATAVKRWRFRPLMANGTPVPFCYFGRFEFKI